MNYFQHFLIRPGTKVSLSNIDPDFTDKHDGKKAALKIIERNNMRLRDLQELLYAEHKRALLICLQAIDRGSSIGSHHDALELDNDSDLSLPAIPLRFYVARRLVIELTGFVILH